ncbi:MAG TPA: NAD(P)H-binding protein, partial [Ornithinibacter sp.]|nr:NAD(P)H-binding protein [Ornithinibacter sp.]
MSQPDPRTVSGTATSASAADAVNAPPSILVLGGTGQIGREVLGALRRRGVAARVLVRDPARLATLEGVDVHVGDLRDPSSLRRALQGVDVVFHIS